jgi:hypothetical protein
MKKIIITLVIISTGVLQAQDTNKGAITKEVVRILDSINKVKAVEEKGKPKRESLWYDKISIRGYAQIRYNGLLSSNNKVSCEQCDRSWGTTTTGNDVKSNNGLFIRRVRISLQAKYTLTYISIFNPI